MVTLNHFGHYEDLHAGDGNEPEREYPENNEGQIDRCFRLPMDFTLIERKVALTTTTTLATAIIFGKKEALNSVFVRHS